MNPLTIKQWAEDDRPREKLLRQGVRSLSDVELLAILIGSGTRNETAVELARRILSAAGNNLGELARLDVAGLKMHKGIGEAKALTVIAAMELGRRRSDSNVLSREVISSSKDAFLVFQPLLTDLVHEEFWIALLNRSNKVIAREKISQGGIAGTVIDVRLIMKTAIEMLASAIILCHNHPSGNLRPSEQDLDITRKIGAAGKLMDVKVLDHIIIADNGYLSFSDEGLLN